MIINFKTIILLKLGFPLKCCKLLKRSSPLSSLFCGTSFTIEFLCILGMWENKFEKNDTMKTNADGIVSGYNDNYLL